jgi:hypothetical protein
VDSVWRRRLCPDVPNGNLKRQELGQGSSGAPLRCPVASSEPAVEISAKDRDEPVVQNLPEANG